MSKYLYGIDFGTTNSALSIYDEEKKEIVNTILIPSLIYFPLQPQAEEKLPYIVGEKAISAYLEDGMEGRFIKSVKQILSKSSFTETRIKNNKYTAADLVAILLKELKFRADQIIKQDCCKAIIGRPVFFDDDDTQKDKLAQTRLRKAAELAGFTELRFQYEPIGAFAYEKTLKRKENVLVADLGGGTTDFTYLVLDPAKLGSPDRSSDIKATGGIYIGGDSFDSAFMWEKGTPYFGKYLTYEATPGKVLTVPKSLFSNICTWDKMNFFNSIKIKKEIETYYYYSKNDPKFKNLITLIDQNLGYSVFQAIEKTKINLSRYPTTDFTYQNEDIKIREDISKDQYEAIIAKDLHKISNYLDSFLIENNIDANAIDSLFLTGGTSLVLAIQSLFQHKFPHVKINTGDHFTSVSKGLAYSDYLFQEPQAVL
jgi:hypothetical chaperone protein